MFKKTLWILLSLFYLSACTTMEDILAERQIIQNEMTDVVQTYLQAVAQQDVTTLQDLNASELTLEQIYALYHANFTFFSSYQGLEVLEGQETYTSMGSSRSIKSGYLEGNIYFEDGSISGFYADMKKVDGTDEWKLNRLTVYPPNPQVDCPLQTASENEAVQVGLCDPQIVKSQNNHRTHFDITYEGEEMTLCFWLSIVEDSEELKPLPDYYHANQRFFFRCLTTQEDRTNYSITMSPTPYATERPNALMTGEPITLHLLVARRTAVGEIVEDAMVYVPLHQEIIEFTHKP